MGMYTEVFFRAELKDDTPESLLQWLNKGNDDFFDGPYENHPFFEMYDWQWILKGSSGYHPVAFYKFEPSWKDKYGHNPATLSFLSSSKGGYSAAGKFVEWIAPYVDQYPGSYVGYRHYEEDDTPDFLMLPDNDKRRL